LAQLAEGRSGLLPVPSATALSRQYSSTASVSIATSRAGLSVRWSKWTVIAPLVTRQLA